MANISRTRRNAGGLDVERTRFQYQDFTHEREIRLLKVHAGKGSSMRCSFDHFQLDSSARPSYRAISYAWDKDDPTYDVWMPGHAVLKVRRNLWDALHSLRDARSDCWLWCDALCIDQDSNEERNHQVKLMADIYSNANVVVVWLVNADETVDFTAAFDSMRGAAIYYHGPASQALLQVCTLRYWTRKWVS